MTEELDLDLGRPVDEVVRVPEDLQAVDLHDSYQHGRHLDYGDEHVLCRHEATNYLIYWGDEQ